MSNEMKKLLEAMSSTNALGDPSVINENIDEDEEEYDDGDDELGAAADWPMLRDERNDPSGEDDWAPHPVIAAWREHGTGAVTYLEVVDEWRDDHAACLAIRATIAGTTYEWSDWWLSREGQRLYMRAEVMQGEEPRTAGIDKLFKDHIAGSEESHS